MKITASYALLIGTVAALLLVLAPGPGVARAQSAMGTPTNLTATPGAGAVYLNWTPPADAEYHFVAWLPVGANSVDAQIRPVDAAGEATITGLLPEQTYHFTVIAGRWERSPTNFFDAKWSGWTPWAAATPLRAALPSASGVDGITSSSTTASARVELVLTIGSLPIDLPHRSSIELYLEDDFRVPDAIGPGSVYFAVANPTTAATGDGSLIAVTDPVEINEGDHFGGDDDWAIRVPLPDLNTGDNFEGFQGPTAGQTLQLVVLKTAGIRNPSEQGTHSVGYSALGPVDVANAGPRATLDTLHTYAKISLSDNANTRGYYLTVTGSGFNNGASAAVHVLADSDTTSNLAAMVAAGGNMEAQACRLIIREGWRAGIATVGSDDKVAVTFEVTAPAFKPGNQNFLCMVDGEGRRSSADVKLFDLEPSLRVSPDKATVGDTVSIFAQDFPNPGAALSSLRIANREVLGPMADPDNRISVYSQTIGNDGAATATFRIPGSVSGIPLEGAIRIAAAWSNVSQEAKITLTGSAALRLSVGEARANESVTIQDEGFGAGSGNYIDPANITIDGVPLLVDNYSLTDYGRIEVSGGGQFVTLVHLWNASGNKNPALIPGAHTIQVVDNEGFYGTASIVIKDPSLTLIPSRVAPRYPIYATIIGSDWPVDNLDSDADVEAVTVAVEGRQYIVIPDATGRFVLEHGGVHPRPGIPATNQVKATYGDGDIVKVTNLEVPAPTIDINPPAAYPGAEVTLSVTGMPLYSAVDEITIGFARVGSSLDLHTDRYGAVTVTVPVPGLDPGAYSVVVRVGSGVAKNLAIGYLTVLP